MKHLCITGFSACLIATLALQTANAEESKRLTGNIIIGTVVSESGDNLTPGGSSETIEDLDHAAKKETIFAPFIVPSLSYDFGEPGGSSIFFNIDPPVDEVDTLGINTGITQEIKGLGTMEYSIFFAPFTKAYKNPYLTGEKRKTTSTIQYGAKIGFNEIMGTGLGMNFAWMNNDVDNDQLAKIQPTLARNGNMYSFKTNYSFYLSENLNITPKVDFRSGNYDGESNNFIKVKYGVDISYTIGKLTIAPEIYYSTSDYDKINPLFNKKRDDKGYGANLALYYAAPFGYENLALITFVDYAKDDSNITFYDTETTTTGLMLSYDFAY